jgi:hypothetical protein
MRASLAVLLTSGASAADIMIATFDGAKATTQRWQEQNDPVMGGKSTGTFKIDGDEHVGIFNGTCAIVPFLKAPGFIKTVSSGPTPDVSSCKNLVLNVNSKTDYKGYKVSFSNAHYPGGKFFAYGYKSDFQAPVGAFGDVVLPFSGFSSHWDDGTGEPITKCADDSKACPTSASLKDMRTISIWAEGKQGDVHLQIKSIRASECAGSTPTLPAHGLGATPGQLVTFDGATGTTFKFVELNDPVMGGKSTGTWSVGDGFGIIDGEVVNVPSLKAPGFIKAAADGKFPDISEFSDGSLVLKVRTSTPDYAGYRVSFAAGAASAAFACAGGGSLPFSRGCFKQKFSVPAGSDFVEVKLPFNTFSDKWSSATGEHNAECAKEKDVCPTAAKLAKIRRIEFWGEGVAGKLHLEVKSVSAEKASGERLVLV